ncbi:MAG: CBS domain containing-hemolysin-like protein [Halieaceae bacterium]|jgi:CBS domain containing-hemolysin-like protein
MLLGNNVSLVLYGLAMSSLLTPFISAFVQNGALVLFIQTIFSTVVILVLAEFLPKVVFSQNPNKSLKIFALPVFMTYYIFYPFVTFINWCSNFIFKYLLRIKVSEEKLQYGLVDLNHYLKEISAGNLMEEELDNEIQIMQNVLEFNSVKARECMVPRNELVAVEIHDEVDQLLNKFLNSGHSKILVYRGTIDRIIGFVHSSDLFGKPTAIKYVLRPITLVPETMAADDVMSLFIKKRQSMAVVVDEFGGTAGILTLEDIVEEIFGEIEDEHDKEIGWKESKVSDTEFIFSSRLEIDYLNEEYDLSLPKTDNYETLAGLIIEYVQSIPEKGDKVIIHNFEFDILSVFDNKINEVKMTIQSAN